MSALAKAFQEKLHPRDPHTGEWIHLPGIGSVKPGDEIVRPPRAIGDSGYMTEAHTYKIVGFDPEKGKAGKVAVHDPESGVVRGNRNRSAKREWLNPDSPRLKGYQKRLPSGLAVAQSNSPYLESKGLHHEFGVFAQHPEYVQDTDRAIETISKRYPIGPTFTGVTPLSKQPFGLLSFKGRRVAKSAIIATSMGREQRILPNDTDQSHIFENLGTNDHDAKIGNMAPSTRSPYGRGLHEMGHVIAAQNGISNDQILTALLDSGFVKLSPTGQALKGGFTPTANDFTGNSVKIDKGNLQKLTKYGAVNLQEAFAEMFGMTNHEDPWGDSTVLPKDRPVYEDMIRRFRESINRQKGKKLI